MTRICNARQKNCLSETKKEQQDEGEKKGQFVDCQLVEGSHQMDIHTTLCLKLTNCIMMHQDKSATNKEVGIQFHNLETIDW